MQSIHPHWQTTDDDERPVRVTAVQRTSSAKTPAAPAVPRAKRGPAAFIGIAIFLGLGFTLFQGMDGLIGQVTTTQETVIRITNTGLDPAIVTVKPGTLIRWENESGIPHILESETLPWEEDESFATTAIFPQDSYEYDLPLDAAEETHDYASRTAADIMGQIIVENTPETTTPEPTAGTTVTPPPARTETTPTNTPDPRPVETAMPVSSAMPTGSIPQNPNTIGNNGTTLPAMTQSQTTAMPISASHQETVMDHLPAMNTTTGMEMWVLLAVAAISVLYVSRKALQ